MKLNGKVVVITGAGSGIGRDTALEFAKAGAKVFITDLCGDRGQYTVKEIRTLGLDAEFFQTEFRPCTKTQAEIHRAVKQFGSLVLMCNNSKMEAFGPDPLQPSVNFELSDYDRMVRINEEGLFHGVLSAGYRMQDLNSLGAVINAAAVCLAMASRGMFGYFAKKGAVKLRIQAAALELAAYLTPAIPSVIPQAEVIPTIPTIYLPTQHPIQQPIQQHFMQDEVLTHAQMQARHQIPKTSLGTLSFRANKVTEIQKGGDNAQ